MIATGGWDGVRLRQEIRRAKELTNKPFGVNLMLMSPFADDIAQVILEEGVRVVTTGAGNPGKYIPAWKEAGIKVMPVVAAAVLAKRLERYGVDAFIAEGTESGGHGVHSGVWESHDQRVRVFSAHLSFQRRI